jgi:prepilin-type N-terminal cleavage/methylation domain-containing protein
MSGFAKKQTSTGFTIVELVIVIVVIAILAAITVLAYNNVQGRAHDAAVKADIANMIKKLEMSKVELGHYPQSHSTAEMPDFAVTKSAYDPTIHNVLYCVDKVNDKYAIGLGSKSGKKYIVNSGTVSEAADILPNSVCGAIGKSWVNDATTGTIHGYNRTYDTWSSSWSWTK